MKELKLWYYIKCPEKVDLLLDQTDDLQLYENNQDSKYIEVIERCSLCGI